MSGIPGKILDVVNANPKGLDRYQIQSRICVGIDTISRYLKMLERAGAIRVVRPAARAKPSTFFPVTEVEYGKDAVPVGDPHHWLLYADDGKGEDRTGSV